MIGNRHGRVKLVSPGHEGWATTEGRRQRAVRLQNEVGRLAVSLSQNSAVRRGAMRLNRFLTLPTAKVEDLRKISSLKNDQIKP